MLETKDFTRSLTHSILSPSLAALLLLSVYAWAACIKVAFALTNLSFPTETALV